MTEKKLRVLIADDLEPMLKGFKDILAFAPDFEIVGLANSAESAVRLTGELKPDVIMLDMSWDRYDQTLGINVIRKIRESSPQTRILVHTAYDHLVDEARKAGAHKALLKLDVNSLDEITRAIRDTYDCFTVQTPLVPEEIGENFAQITGREKEVLELVCKGYPNKQIAAELTISPRTVKNHVTAVLGKLGVKSRTEAVALVHKYHLLNH